MQYRRHANYCSSLALYNQAYQNKFAFERACQHQLPLLSAESKARIKEKLSHNLMQVGCVHLENYFEVISLKQLTWLGLA